MKKILFVCSANKQRSKTAEDFFSEKYPNYEFLSAGTNLKICRKEGTNPLSEDMLAWADQIFVMERRHRNLIKENSNFNYESKIIILDILDKYKYYDRTLIDLLESKISLS